MQILPYLLHLAKNGLSHASIKVHLAAISRYRRKLNRPSLWSQRIIKGFLKGLFRVFPAIKQPSILWQLNVVLSGLMKPPFEPIHKAELQFISWKVALLLALTSARRVSEIQAFSVSEPFLQFKSDRVILRTNPKFIPKVPTVFHLNEPILLPTYFRNPSSVAER